MAWQLWAAVTLPVRSGLVSGQACGRQHVQQGHLLQVLRLLQKTDVHWARSFCHCTDMQEKAWGEEWNNAGRTLGFMLCQAGQSRSKLLWWGRWWPTFEQRPVPQAGKYILIGLQARTGAVLGGCNKRASWCEPPIHLHMYGDAMICSFVGRRACCLPCCLCSVERRHFCYGEDWIERWGKLGVDCGMV